MGEGMLTSVWGPSLWHSLHTISFNYPVKPTEKEKTYYMNFMKSLVHVLPCRYCRENLVKNYKTNPLSKADMKDRHAFSRYVYSLHEIINKMLGKESGLSYCDVRDRYEHFRARCTKTSSQQKMKTDISMKNMKKYVTRQTRKLKKTKESGCVEPMYGKKAKCIIKIVPQDEKGKTFQMDESCKKRRKE
tara:strand:- start:198 stop:764 length:567 start_codon:yes stop_codon:yes gene_type:complete